MGAKIIIQPGEGEPFEVPIGNTATIGRTKENTICLSASPLVSRQHALIRCHNGYEYQLIDLGSRNGTFYDDQRVIMPVTLKAGAKIRIANNTLTFAEIAEAECQEQLQVTVAGTLDASIQTRPVALMVCDIRGFSTMAEKTPSGDLAQFLGAWFREAGNLVNQSGGTIDKFIGDAILAYWGNSQNSATDCAAAFTTAKLILAQAAARLWPNREPFRVAIALHYGRVTCSNVGVTAERDATIIGDVVNTVFRLESVSKELNQLLVASRDLVAELDVAHGLMNFGERSLKGKSQLVGVYGLGDAADSTQC